MSIYFGNNIKVFVTSNLDVVDNSILLTGLTTLNTGQILVSAGSLAADQLKETSYVDKSGLLDNAIPLETLAKTNLPVGNLSLTTYLNSSDTGPFDIQLWNSLISKATYPGNVWSISSSDITGNLVRQSTTIKPIGIIVVCDDMAYLFDNVRVSSVDLSLGVDELVTSAWKLTFTNYRIVSGISYTSSELVSTFSGNISGEASLLNEPEYRYCPAKLMLSDIYTSDGYLKIGSLALTNLSISIYNNLAFIQNNSMDRTSISSTFVYAGTFSISGNLSFYNRKSDTFITSILNDITNNNNSPSINNTYSFKFDIPFAKDRLLCSIFLGNCNVTLNTDFSGALTSSLNLKLVDSSYADNCFIKFYT